MRMRAIQQSFRTEVGPVDLSTRCRPLDGVRGLAVLLVLCYDCLKLPSGGGAVSLLTRKLAGSGWTGVDLFFVLSGFLITGILLDTRGRAGYWKSFLLRRAVRIFPLYYLTLAGVFVVIPFLAARGVSAVSDWIPHSLLQDQLWYWTYLQNWLFALNGAWPDGRVLNHFWSLAVEEQFYLVWPLVVAVLSPRGLRRLCLAVCAGALLLRIGILHHSGPGVGCYVLTITRADSLCLGALLALLLRDSRFVERWGWAAPSLLFASMATLVLIDSQFPILKGASVGAYSIGHTLIGLTFACLIAAAVLVPATHPLARCLSLAPLLHLGKYSYAIYVFHRAVYAGVLQLPLPDALAPLHGWVVFGLTILGSLAAAHVCWRLVEQPALSLKRYFPRPDQSTEPSPHRSELPQPKPSLQVTEA